MNWDRLRTLVLEPLDLYCERTDAALLSEPLNCFSNFAFYLAAAGIFSLRKGLSSPMHRRELTILGILALIVGTGSALFHSFANRLSQVLDVAPIAVFVFVSFFFYVRNLKREKVPLQKPLGFGLGVLILPALFAYASGHPEYFAKGESYLGIAPALLVFAIYEKVPARKIRLCLASGLFLLALIFRTLDQRICDIFPYGTHFLWHLLTTTCAYLMASIQAVTGRSFTLREE